ncbi:hypothetical protein F5884DRAFT_903161 [Xylogone sp. PMI_703]|nr:hypothetical protein F5884DRAFT_903161 [Xylogone sp. PMI_703]
MDSSSPQSRLADGPFKLIETPIHAQKLSRPCDQYIEAASVMAVAHNAIIRGLNSIYKQAPHVAPHDKADFIAYAYCWGETLDNHHRGEENCFFPRIEEESGEKSLMDESIAQHHVFLPGLESYQSYLKSMASKPKEFSGTHLNELIDQFAPALMHHLSDEIPCILELSRFGDKLKVLAAENAMRTAEPLSRTEGTIFFLRNLDADFEDGLWSHWPPIPPVIKWIVYQTFGRWNSRWWKFASCDENGRLRELYALGE